MNNTNRIYSLIRAGTLYLTVQDALALAIENNLNLEIDRYIAADRRLGGGTRAGRRPDPRRPGRRAAGGRYG